MLRKSIIAYSIFLLLLIILCAAYYEHILSRLPFGMHDWAQGDRLALAMKFYDNGFNFFKPATYSQFSINGICGVEFPLQAYIAALLGIIFGRENILECFRLLDIFIACTGLFFLFLTVWKSTKDFVFSIAAPVFIFCSPVYIYYSGNFLPDAAAVSVCFIAFYFLQAYLEKDKTKYAVYAIAVLTLATLIKTTIIFYLIGLLAFAFFKKIFASDKKLKATVPIIIAGLISGAILLANYLHIQHLNEKYQSTLFLSKPEPFRNWREFQNFLDHSFKPYQMYNYFVLPQYVLLVMILSISLYLLSQRKKSAHLFLMLIFFIAGICGVLIMGHQLLEHDYYILAMFFPFIGFACYSAFIELRLFTNSSSIHLSRLVIAVALIFTFFFTDHEIDKKNNPDANTYDASKWHSDNKRILDSLKINTIEKILVLDDYPPNLSLVYFDRNGYVIPPYFWGGGDMNFTKIFMEEHNVHYAICTHDFAKEKSTEDSSFKGMKLLYDNKFCIYRFSK